MIDVREMPVHVIWVNGCSYIVIPKWWIKQYESRFKGPPPLVMKVESDRIIYSIAEKNKLPNENMSRVHLIPYRYSHYALIPKKWRLQIEEQYARRPLPFIIDAIGDSITLRVKPEEPPAVARDEIK